MGKQFTQGRKKNSTYINSVRTLKQDSKRSIGTFLFNNIETANWVKQTVFLALLSGFILKSEKRIQNSTSSGTF